LRKPEDLAAYNPRCASELTSVRELIAFVIVITHRRRTQIFWPADSGQRLDQSQRTHIWSKLLMRTVAALYIGPKKPQHRYFRGKQKNRQTI